MAWLLLFAAVREAARCRTAQVPGSSVGEALAVASRRFGPAFERLLPVSTLLVDDEAVSRSEAWPVPVADSTEIAYYRPCPGAPQMEA